MAASKDNLEHLLRLKKGNFRKLDNFVNFYNNHVTEVEGRIEVSDELYLELKLRLETLKEAKTSYEEIQSNINCLVSADMLESQYEEQDDFLNKYFKYVAMSEKIFTTFETVSSKVDLETKASQDFEVKLPTINLPKFLGGFEQWLSFKSVYESLIHKKSSISDIQKFHYLKAALDAEPLSVIESLEFSDANYKVAWDLLCNRYDNKELLIQNHIKALFNLPMVDTGKELPSMLRSLNDSVLKHLRVLQTLGQPTDKWDPLLIYMISSKLDRGTLCEWERTKLRTKVLTVQGLLDFLKERASLLESLEYTSPSTKKEVKPNNPQKTSKSLHVSTKNNKVCCNYCGKSHKIYYCEEFKKLSVDDRLKKVKELTLCENCLCSGHKTKDCKWDGCKLCKEKHNQLLHLEQTVTSQFNGYSSKNNSSLVLLATAEVCVVDKDGVGHQCTVLLDCGSQPSFVTESLVKKLKLNKQPYQDSIIGINNTPSVKISSKCTVKVKSRLNSYEFELSCLVLPQITSNIPGVQFSTNKLKLPSNLPLADPKFYVPKCIDLLIGASTFWELIEPHTYYLGKNLPVLQATKLGYLVTGEISLNQKSPKNNSAFFTLSETESSKVGACIRCENSIDFDLKKFWQLENLEKPIVSPEDMECEKLFVDTYTRNESGQFVVRIPFKPSIAKLGHSESIALKRFLSQESRLKTQEVLKSNYCKFMSEYETLGHMSLVENNYDSPNYFFSHHAVVKEESLTTKLRVVFHGSLKTTSGLSINDVQMIGPTIQNDIVDILLRFRLHNIVVTADISKMYRRILIHPDDRKFQRIFWRSEDNETLKIFELNTVTYGTASAPFLALRCLKELANLNQKQFPKISEMINEDFYIDDYLGGFKTEEETVACSKQLIQIMNSAQLELRKWRSNSENVLKILSMENDDPLNVLQFEDVNIKTLGIQWSCQSDTFSYFVSENQGVFCSKRIILSEIAKIYDPLGLISPCLIQFKMLLKTLWTLKVDWDEEVPETIKTKWLALREKLVKLSQIKISRHCVLNHYTVIELHGFCDSSEEAYGCCMYLRTENSEEANVTLLCAKSRVAPLKPTTIPRLELCAALLLSKMVAKVLKALKTKIPCFLWCDSEVTLWWIHTEPHKLQTFVGNRVCQIQELTKDCQWNYVNTKENPADLITRGLNAQELIDSDLWFSGPEWLLPFDQSKNVKTFNINENVPELKKQETKSLIACSEYNLFSKYSSFRTLLHVHAYCLRFISNLKINSNERQKGDLCISELNSAEKSLIKLSQLESFSLEINYLKTGNNNVVKNTFKSLAPFFDENDLLRVGGRLKNASLPFDTKHPYILSSKHSFTKLLFIHEHLRLHHAGPQLLLHTIRQKYWVVGGLNLSKKVVRSCVKCVQFNPKVVVTKMGDLPADRVSGLFPFKTVGIDFCGPFQIKDRKGRGCKVTKGYLCLFICFSTKAVHLELCSELSTDNFLNCLKRFISRRGYPTDIFSDNGTNFVGAANSLNDLQKCLSESEKCITNYCSSLKIQWHFIPPRSPHFGGLWESNVKNAKNYLLKIISGTILTFEEFYTITVQVEAILNSRPLYPMSTDPNDMTALTPSHFLIGRIMVLPRENDVTHLKLNLLNRYQLLKQLIQGFWKKWSQSYLSSLQQRRKWTTTSTTLKVGDLVSIKTDNLPPYQWPLARVIQLHPGSDGEVRVATIKTATTTYKRPVAKLCPLPTEPDVEASLQGWGNGEKHTPTNENGGNLTSVEVATILNRPEQPN